MALLRSALLIGSIAVFSYNLAQLIIFFGFNIRVYNHVPGECTAVTLGEDAMSATSFAKIDDKIIFPFIAPDKEDTPAGFFTYDAKNRSAHHMALDKNLKNINPSGIAVWKKRIFVVNSNAKESTVESLTSDKANTKLTHHATIRSKKFAGLKDIAAVGKNKFFATVWAEEENEWLRTAYEYTGMDKGAIVFFDGTNVRYVDRNITSPIGLVYDERASKLFVASHSGEAIVVYNVSERFALKKERSIPLNSAPTYMWQGLDQSLIVATHPVRVREIANRINRTSNYAPTQILRVHVAYFGFYLDEIRIDALYTNDGATISAAQAAIVHGNALIMGGAHNQILSCTLPPYLSFSL